MSVEKEVKKLGERVQKVQKELAQERENKKKREDPRWKEILESAQQQRMDFWCDTCQQDYSGMGRKVICGSYDIDTGVFTPRRDAYYLAFCPERHRMVRYILDIHQDPYYRKSVKVRMDRWKYRDDLLTPNDPRFKIVYPERWKEIEQAREQRDNATK